MQQTQIVTYGIGGVLADRLRDLAKARRTWLRETSQYAACRSLVQSAAPPVFIVVLGRDLERELGLIEQVHATQPDTAIVAIGETENATLAGLAWDLGATYVHFPPQSMEMIVDVVTRLLEEAGP